MGAGQVQVDGFAGLEQRFQGADLFPKDGTDSVIHSTRAEVFAVADAQLAEVDRAGCELVGGDGITQRVGLPQPGAGAQLQQGIGNIATHGAYH